MLASEFRGGGISHGCLTSSGYCQVVICTRNFQVHRLVAYAFLGPPPSEAAWQVNHIDGNCSNNRIDNLEWATRSENIRHSYATNPSRVKGRVSTGKASNDKALGVIATGPDFHPSKRRQKHCVNRNQQFTEDAVGIRRWMAMSISLPLCSRWSFQEKSGVPMIEPRSGRLVSGKMLSSHGENQIKSWTYISRVCQKRRVLIYKKYE